MKDDSLLKGQRLVGYVRVEKREQLLLTSQDSVLEKFAGKELFDLVHIEHDVSNGSQVMRMGLWKALRMMICQSCEPKQMPMSLEYDTWFREAVRPCNCQRPESSKGILVTDIGKISQEPSKGAKFTLDMCASKKHLFVVQEKRCLSCCNPQAIAVVRRSMNEEFN